MNQRLRWAVILAFTSFIVLIFVVSCTAPPAEGANGERGAQGPAGPAGPQGPPGVAGAAGLSLYAPGDGVTAEITEVVIGEDLVPVVTFSLADKNGIPMSMEQMDNVRFLIARIDEDAATGLTQYVNYFVGDVEGAEYTFEGETRQPELATATQPRYEAGEGEFAQVSAGTFTYTFGEALGEGYNPDTTHVVGIIATRVPRVTVANDTYTFVPSGGTPELTRLISTTDTCNGCHNQLAFHGGSRRQLEVCVLCHTPQNVDPESGNTTDLKVMIHRIHSGSRLPSVQAENPYFIVGYRGNVYDFSPISWTQETQNCTTCHTGPDGANFMTAPSIAACSSCHDDVNLETGENHAGGGQADGSCANCHAAEGEDFDTSITGAHVVARYSSQASPLTLEILGVEGAVPGGSPVVTFKVSDAAGTAIAPADMAYLALTLAGPTSDYTTRVTETIYRASTDPAAPAPEPVVEEAADGAYVYTFTYKIPADATGSYAIGMEGYVMQAIEGVEDPVRMAGFNPVTYVALDGGEPHARRQVVDRELCNACHNNLALHGTIRQNTEYCVLCHNATASDEAQRPAESMPPTSINFRVLVHRLHRGEEAANPVLVYGRGSTLYDFSEVAFPGNLADCETCHLPNTYTLPLASSVGPTIITQSGRVVSTTSAVRSICTACHDSEAVSGHIELQTTGGGVETCTVCHGVGKEFAVETVHR